MFFVRPLYHSSVFGLILLCFSLSYRYVDSKRAEKLKDLQEKHTLSESQFQKCEIRKQEISTDLNKSRELMRNQDQLKRNIDDNLNYRKTKAEVDELTQEIESLEQKVLSVGSMSTLEAEHKRHLQEKERVLSEVPDLTCSPFSCSSKPVLFSYTIFSFNVVIFQFIFLCNLKLSE